MSLKSGGQARLDIFEVADVGGTLTVVKEGTTTPADAQTDALISFSGDYQNAQFSHSDSGLLSSTFNNYKFDQDFIDFMENHVHVAGASAGKTPVKMENGVEKGGTSSSGKMYVALYYGHADGSNILVRSFFGAPNPTSGGYTSDADNYSAPQFIFTGSAASGDLSVPVALYDSAIVTPAGAVTISENKNKKDVLMPAA